MLLATNAYGRAGGQKSGRGGRALLAGMLTCGRCGRGLAVAYAGAPPGRPTYRCDRPNLMLGLPRCLSFGGSRADAAIASEILRVVEPMALEAEWPGASIPADAPVGSSRATAPSRTASAVAWGSTARWAGLASVCSFPAMTSPEELRRRPRRVRGSSRSDRDASDTRGVPRFMPTQATGSSIHAATTVNIQGNTSIWTDWPDLRRSMGNPPRFSGARP